MLSSKQDDRDLIQHRSGDQHIGAKTPLNPFEEVKPHISEYTAKEIATLSSRLEKQLGPEYISSRPGAAGQKVHYLAADKCINLANDVFGFNGWSSGIQNIQIDFVSHLSCAEIYSSRLKIGQVDENQSTGKVSLGLSVIVRVTLRDGTYHEANYNTPLRVALKANIVAGYWIWSYRKLQGESCGFRKGKERGHHRWLKASASKFWQYAWKLHL